MASKESAHEGKYLGQKWLLTQPVRSRDRHYFPWTPFRQGRKEKTPRNFTSLRGSLLVQPYGGGISQVATPTPKR